MQLLNMRYKDYVFPSNPAEIEVVNSKSISESALLSGDFNACENARNAAVIKASGVFYGSEADKEILSLSGLFNESGEGWLFLPGGRCYKAYFKSFTFSESADKSSVSYKLVFLEKSAGRKEAYDFGYTFAREGENAFDIAKRCGISIEALMDCNCIKTPFDIEEGDRIWLN